MSASEESDTVTMRARRRATRDCMRVKPYQRRSVRFLTGPEAWASSTRRSTVMGWWIVPSTGKPMARRPSRPVPSDWLSWTTSKSRRRSRRARSARRLNDHGSGKPAVHMSANSATSIQEWNSRHFGMRNGSGSR